MTNAVAKALEWMERQQRELNRIAADEPRPPLPERYSATHYQAAAYGICADKLRAALASHGTGWRDMADAPKDGTEVDIADHLLVEVGIWQPGIPEKREGGVIVQEGWPAGWWGNEFYPGYRQPTHWRPRPAPPAKEPKP